MTSVTLKDNIYTFTLIRDSKKVVYEFTRAYCIILCMEKEANLELDTREKILGPAFDGMLYWIDVGFPGEWRAFWLSEEEFDILEPMLIEEENKHHYDMIDSYFASPAKSA